MSADWSDLLARLPALAKEVPAERVPAAIAGLASVQAMLATRMVAAPVSAGSATDKRLSVAELADHLGIGESTLRRRVQNGDLKSGKHYWRVGRRLLFDLAAVETHLRDQEPQCVKASASGAIPFVRKGRKGGEAD